MRRTVGVIAIAVSAAGLAAPPAHAGDNYVGKDLSVRLASAFIRFTEVSAYGGETVANRWSSASNPASAAWERLPGRWGVVAAPYWSHLSFDSGNEIDIYGQSLTWDTRRVGVIQPTLAQLRSNDVVDRTGLAFDYDTNLGQVQWAKKKRNWAVGVMGQFGSTELIRRAGPLQVARSTSDTYRIRLGGLYQPRCRWLVGAIAEYGWSPFTTNALVPGGAFAPGLIPVTIKDTQTQGVLRTGVSYEYKKYSTVFLDYQYAWFENDRDSLKPHRWFGGVQHRLLEFLFLRAGATMDDRGNEGLMVGATAAFARWGQIHFGYQYDVLPELRTEFGRSDTFQLTLSISL